MASANTIASVNVALNLQTAAFQRNISHAVQQTQQATQQIQRSLQTMNTGFMQAGRAVTQFANGFKTLFAAQQMLQAARAVADYSDSWQQAGNKIAAAEQISGRQARSLADINKIAIETRSSIDATTDLYAKMLRTTANVAKSEEEVARATRVVAQGFKAGGASTLEMENGIRQLAQALGSGILQGDELRSIRENAPLIAKAIADEMGTTVAGLKALGAEGKITSDVIFKALLKSENDVGAAFGRTNSTIAESFTNLGNAFTQYIGQASQASGTTKTITDSVNALATGLNSAAASRFWSNPIVQILSTVNAAFRGVGAAWRFFEEALNPTSVVAIGEATRVTTGTIIAQGEALEVTGLKLKSMGVATSELDASSETLRQNLPTVAAGFKSVSDQMKVFDTSSGNINDLVADLREVAQASSLVRTSLPSTAVAHTKEQLFAMSNALKSTNTQLDKTGTAMGTVVHEGLTFGQSVSAAPLEQFELAGQSSTEQMYAMGVTLDSTNKKLDLASQAMGKIVLAGNDMRQAGFPDLLNMSGFKFDPNASQDLFPKKNTKASSDPVKQLSKETIKAHEEMISSVGTLEEQYKQKFDLINKTYKMFSDNARMQTDLALDKNEAILDSLEGFGALINPMERATIARQRVTQVFGEGANADRANAGITLKTQQALDSMADSMGRVLSPAEELANRIRDINAAKAAGIEVGNAVEQQELRAADSQLALRENLGLSLTNQEAYDQMNRKIAESVGLVATQEERAALAVLARVENQNRLTQAVGLTVDPFAQLQADLATIEAKKNTDINVTSAQVGAYARLGGEVLNLAGNATQAFGSMFKDNKAFAIANAVISTAEAVMKSLGTFGVTPWGIAAAAVAAATGAAQIATIMSAQPGGGGKVSGVKGGGGGNKKIKAVSDAGSSSTSSKSSTAPVLKQAVTIVVEGDSFGPEHFKKLVKGINGVVADGAVLRMSNR